MPPKDESASVVVSPSAIKHTTNARVPVSPVHAMETLITTVRTLASEKSYKEIASIFDEIPSLKEQIASKDSELENLRTEIAKLKATHENVLDTNLELYRTKHNKLDEEKVALSKDTSSLKATIRQRDDTLAELGRTQKGLQWQLDQAKESFGDAKKRVEAANKEVITLEQNLKTKDTEINELKERLGKQENQALKTESQLKEVEKENASLKQKLQTNTARVAELEGFATKLHEEDEEVL